MSALAADDLVVRIGSRELLHGVDLALCPHEVLGLVGPNGAGKSTLLRSLVGVLHPSAGVVMLDGAPIQAHRVRELARRIAFVTQDHAAPAELTVLDLVLVGRYAHRGRLSPLHAEDTDTALAALRTVGLERLVGRRMSSLSGGERQLAHLARALAQQAPILLLDEPTAALDLGHQLRVFELLRAHAASGGSVVVVLHDLGQAARFCDRIAIVADGRIVASGSPAEVLTSERIADVYGVVALVQHDPVLGAPTVLPLRLVPTESGAPTPIPR